MSRAAIVAGALLGVTAFLLRGAVGRATDDKPVADVQPEPRALAPQHYGRDRPLPPGHDGWTRSELGAIRGVTVGPIESAVHPGVGYGTDAGRAAMMEARAMGATWIALTPFGRVWDLDSSAVDLRFEAPLEQNVRDVLQAMHDAHGLGMKVMLVPHLWVESGAWRAHIDPGTDAGWRAWAASYARFILHWAEIAEQGSAEMFSVGVELRSWVTTHRAPSFLTIIDAVRSSYSGLITYSANWDDLEHTVILGQLDVIGVNAFFPLTQKEDANYADLALGGQRVSADLAELAHEWDKPIVLTEMGYTTRRDPALRPWEWPDKMKNVVLDEHAQAIAYRALLAPLVDSEWCAGFFVWRTYADPHDVSQEAAWGFSPRGKLAEIELRDAFTVQWQSDGAFMRYSWAGRHRTRRPGLYPLPRSQWH